MTITCATCSRYNHCTLDEVIKEDDRIILLYNCKLCGSETFKKLPKGSPMTGVDFGGNMVMLGSKVVYVATGGKSLKVGTVTKISPKGFTIDDHTNRPKEWVYKA